MLTPELTELTELFGLQVSYWDDGGKLRHSPLESVITVLKILGAELTGVHDAGDALRATRLARWRTFAEPLVVAWAGDCDGVKIRRVIGQASEPVECVLELESGETRAWTCECFQTVQAVDVEGQRFVEQLVALPKGLPLGYHKLRLGGEVVNVISAPNEAYHGQGERDWGSFLPLYAIRTSHDHGVGDFTSLAELAEWTRRRGGTTVGMLPIMAGFLNKNEKLYEPSPYSPASKLFWNEVYLDLERIPELKRCPEAARHLASAAYQSEKHRLRAADLVDYSAALALKRPVLESLADAFFANPGSRQKDFDAFLTCSPRATEYAAFRATCEKKQASWWVWPERARGGVLTPDDYDQAAYRYHLYSQWQAHEQLAAVHRTGSCGLFLDLPLGICSDSYDVWRERSSFALGASVGAPPDGWTMGGQDWGFPAPHPVMQRKQGYHYLRESLAHVMRFASWVRIDHMPALHRLFLIPYGAKPTEGVYVRYAHQDQYAIYSLESHRRRVRLAGEDMGTLPEDLRPSMLKHKIDRIFAAQYQPPVANDPAEGLPTANSIAGMSTHDLATFAAFWRGEDITDRLALGLITKDQVNAYTRHREKLRREVPSLLKGEPLPTSPHVNQVTRALNFVLNKLGVPPRPMQAWTEDEEFAVLKQWLAHIAKSDSGLALVSLEDFWLSPNPQNVPSTTTQRPNWRHRAHHELEQYDLVERVNEAIELLARMRPAKVRKAA